MFKQDFEKVYVMTTSDKRDIIIHNINNLKLISETETGKKEEWWLKKHNPDNDIPKNIYLLGNGTIRQLHDKYNNKYGFIEWSEFINYTRELIKQHIML